MKMTSIIFFILLHLGTSSGQSINIEEMEQTPPLVDSHFGSVALGDIDNDSDLDLFVTGKDGAQIKSTLYTNDGNGNFTEVTGTSFEPVNFGHVEFADVDGDGDEDLLIAGSNGQPSLFSNLYLNDGTGNFSLAPDTPFEPMTEGDFEFADVDNDGDLDVLITGYNSSIMGFASLYLNNGSGIFTEVAGTPFEQVSGSSVAFVDIENDNDFDVIISGSNDDGTRLTRLYANDGNANFSLVNNTSFSDFDLGDIGIADSDNDGDMDIFICGFGNQGRLSELYINDGTGSFTLLSGTSFITTFLGTSDFADLDNDGDMDILITGAVQGAEFAANIYENQGDNSFALVGSLVDAYRTSTAFGDINGDTNLDIIIAGITSETSAFKTRTYINQPLPLPVNLISFTAKTKDENAVDLLWQTSGEENNDYFSIEYSTDGNLFRELERKNGHGTTYTLQNYHYLHENLDGGWHYYRLKQIDFDGKFEYSNIVSAKIKGQVNANNITLMPNPTTDRFSVQFKTPLSRNEEVQILDTTGALLSSRTLVEKSEHIDFDLSHLPNGIYYLKLVQDNNLIIKKIIKQ